VFLAAGGFGSRFRYEQIFGDLIAKSVLSLLSDVVPSEEIFSDMRGCCRLQFYQVCLARGEHESAAALRRKFRDAIRRSYQGAKFPDSIEMSEAILRCRQALLTCVALAISLTIMNAKNLDELRWKERVILI
jgi:hypothetical protein